MNLSLLFVAFLVYYLDLDVYCEQYFTNQPPSPPLDNHPCLIAKWGWPLLDCFLDRNVSSLYDSTFVTQAQSMMIVIIPTNFQNQIVSILLKTALSFTSSIYRFRMLPPLHCSNKVDCSVYTKSLYISTFSLILIVPLT